MAKELILTESEKITMSNLQKDLIAKNKQAKKAKEILESFIKNHTIDIFRPIKKNSLITRDMNLVKEFLKEGNKSSLQICEFLELKLAKEIKRWSVLDTGSFDVYIGRCIRNQIPGYETIKSEKINGRLSLSLT